MHAPEVVCIAKGKARTPYEFGAKVGIATTNREGLVLAARAFEGNPYGGHTLAATVAQAVAVGGVEPARIFVDKGDRGHDYAGAGSVMIAGQKCGLTPTMRRELRRRSTIEAIIGHMKTDAGFADGPRFFDEREVRLTDFDVVPGLRFHYLYDFGDGRQHEIEVENLLTLDEAPRYVTYIAGEGARPPEDVDGYPGYERFLAIIADPGDPE